MFRFALVSLGLLLIGSWVVHESAAAQEASPVASPVAPVDLQAAASYCVEKGGTVHTRVPILGANLEPSSWIVLGGARQFCDFRGMAGDDSAISLSLETLYSEEPTLAALVYLTKPPVPESGGANPSTMYCAHLGGAYNFGSNMTGGGWVIAEPTPSGDVTNYCVFADGSMIDAWGLTYHSGGVVRGADLTPILRYQATDYPRVWG